MNAVARYIAAAVSLPAIVDVGDDFGALPKEIKKPIAKLIVAFPAGTQAFGEGDGRLRMDTFAEAISGFPIVVVLAVLEWFLFNNPNNPFCPTPQDVRHACEADFHAWKDRVRRYASGEEWSPFTVNRSIRGLKAGNTRRHYEDCSPPWADGCHLSPSTVKDILSESGEWKSILAPYINQFLTPPPDEIFNRIPHDVFAPGEREELEKRRVDWHANTHGRRAMLG